MLTDDRVAGILRGRIYRANGFMDNRASDERIKVADYMAGKLPAPIHKGNSRYVSNDVFDSTESMKSQLVETFCGAHQTIRFMPQTKDDVEQARIDTEVCNFVMDRQNDGFQIKQDVIHDGLTARMGVVKVWWEKSEEESEDAFEGNLDDLTAYLADKPDAEAADDAEVTPDGSISATFTNKDDTSQVKIVVIPREEFLYSGGAASLADCDLVCHRKRMTASELEAMGFEHSVVKELPGGTEWITTSMEATGRARETEDVLSRDDNTDEDAGRQIEVFECFTKLDMTASKGRSGRRLWQVIIAGNTVLSKEEVKRSPFVGFIPLPKPHTIQGENFAARIIPTQNARTALMRSIIDHATITTNPRYTVLRNGLPNPAELLENRIGGVVNMTKADAVGVLPQSPLNPFIFQTIGQLDMDREEVTGISKLSQGLNKDAISQQNSGAMVEQLISMSQVRQKVIARRFGEFLKNVYLMIHQLIVENADKSFSIEVAGNWVQIDPSAIKNRKDISLDVALGYGEKDKEAQKYINVDKYLAADPRLGQSYDGPRRYTVLTRALEGLGIKDTDSILADPRTLQPPPPDPKAQLEMEKLKADIAVQTAQAQATSAKLQIETQKLQMEHELKMAQHQLEMARLQATITLEREKQDFKEKIDTAEFRLAEKEAAEGQVQTMIQTPRV